MFEIIVSFLFLGTGIYLITQLPLGGKFDYLFWIKLIMVFGSIPIAVIGFRKHNKLLAALSLLLITGAFGLAEVYHKRKAIPKDNVEIASNDGKTLYENNCKLCHGDDGLSPGVPDPGRRSSAPGAAVRPAGVAIQWWHGHRSRRLSRARKVSFLAMRAQQPAQGNAHLHAERY